MIIAHRGNLNGSVPHQENTPESIYRAYSKNFFVEIDVWLTENELWLGHDRPTIICPTNILYHSLSIFHAKNLEALTYLLDLGLHCFFHNTDGGVLTSKGYIWTYPGQPVFTNSIVVMPENYTTQTQFRAAGVCTDYPSVYTVLS
jgi:glycerophosphoryl diester phosphodiesterase